MMRHEQRMISVVTRMNSSELALNTTGGVMAPKEQAQATQVASQQEATREARSPISCSRSSRGAVASEGEKIAATIVNVTWTTTSAMTVPSNPEKFEPPCGI